MRNRQTNKYIKKIINKILKVSFLLSKHRWLNKQRKVTILHFSENWVQTEQVLLLSNLNVLLAPEPAAEIHLWFQPLILFCLTDASTLTWESPSVLDRSHNWIKMMLLLWKYGSSRWWRALKFWIRWFQSEAELKASALPLSELKSVAPSGSKQ